MRHITPGICRYCGCSDERGCPGGCWWVDAAHTICSRCSAPAGQADTVGEGLHIMVALLRSRPRPGPLRVAEEEEHRTYIYRRLREDREGGE